MKKRSMLITLCLFLLAGILAACSGTNKAEETTAPSDAAGATSTVKPAETAKPGVKTKLSYWTNDRHDSEYIKGVIEKFNATNTDNIEVEYVVKTEEYDQAIDLSFATAQTPDIFRVKDGNTSTFVKKGYLAPIDGYVTEEQKTLFPMLNNINSFDGKRYTMPNYGSTMRLVYNVELFEKAGIKNPPATLKEMVEDAKLLTAAGKADGAYGFAQNFKSPASALGRSARVIAETSGFGGFGYDFKTGRYDFSGFAPIIEAFKQMKDDGSTLPGMESLDIDPLRAQFAEGKLGMYLSYSSEPGVYKNQFPAKIKWSSAPAPSVDGIKGASGFVGGQWLGLSSKSKYPDQAWKFMNYMYQQDILQGYHEQGFGITMVPAVATVAAKPDIAGIEGFLPNSTDGVWPIYPVVAVQGMKSDDAFFKYILSGGDIKATITDLNKRYNEALDAGIKSGEIKAENAAPMPDFDPAKLAGQFAK